MTGPMPVMLPGTPGLEVEPAMVALEEQLAPEPADAAPPEAPNLLPDDDEDRAPYTDAELKDCALAQLYGDDFPLIGMDDEPSRDDWAQWAKSLFDRHEAGVVDRRHLVERNRLFRIGKHWVASRGGGPWREPVKPASAARVVDNMIAPALDQRIQILSEQRPGFRTRPTNMDVKNQKRAEAQQLALEYQYEQQRMDLVTRETGYVNTTDAVAFWHLKWNPERGPWYETLDQKRFPLGEIHCEVLKMEQVRVSSNASSTERPMYWVVRKTRTLAEAVRTHGGRVAEGRQSSPGSSSAVVSGRMDDRVDDAPLHADQETVDEYTVYCEKSEYLPKGLTLTVVGDDAVFLGDLLFGIVPMVRVTDGTSDPAWFPQAQMEEWLDDQMRINAALSKWTESIVKNSGGRLMARPGAVTAETLVGGLLSVVEVKAPGPIGEFVQPMPSFSVGTDVKEMLAMAVKRLEDKTGWNDTSRGSVASSTSGRAILANREQLERVFAPSISSHCEAMTEWGKICLHMMRWGYDIPRTVALTGSGRSDLARELSSEDFDGIADVQIDPETMVPLPRALRMFMLDDLLAKKAIDLAEYRRRMPFSFVQNLETPDTDHAARAKRVASAIRNRQPPPLMRWQDNEAIHQDVLEREILLQDEHEEDIIAAATQRWTELATQQQSKMNPMGAPPGGPAPGAPPMLGPGAPDGSGEGLEMSPTAAPLSVNDPSVAAAPVAQTAVQDDPALAAAQFDRITQT